MIAELIQQAVSGAYPDAKIYLGQAAQIGRPAFYIAEIKVNQAKAVGNRYYRDHQMVVRYFPQADQADLYKSLSTIADQLYAALEYLQAGEERARGIQMSHRIEDGILQFYLTVRQVLKRTLDETKMEHITVDRKIKE